MFREGKYYFSCNGHPFQVVEVYADRFLAQDIQVFSDEGLQIFTLDGRSMSDRDFYLEPARAPDNIVDLMFWGGERKWEDVLTGEELAK